MIEPVYNNWREEISFQYSCTGCGRRKRLATSIRSEAVRMASTHNCSGRPEPLRVTFSSQRRVKVRPKVGTRR